MACYKRGNRSTYADSNEELIEVDVTIAVCVEKGHKGVSFGARYLDLDLAEARVELLGVNLVVSIERVEVSEGAAETSDGLGTTSLNLISNSFQNCKQKKSGSNHPLWLVQNFVTPNLNPRALHISKRQYFACVDFGSDAPDRLSLVDPCREAYRFGV